MNDKHPDKRKDDQQPEGERQYFICDRCTGSGLNPKMSTTKPVIHEGPNCPECQGRGWVNVCNYTSPYQSPPQSQEESVFVQSSTKIHKGFKAEDQSQEEQESQREKLERFVRMVDDCLSSGIPIEKDDPIHQVIQRENLLTRNK